LAPLITPHNCDVISEFGFQVPVEPQNRTQFSAIGTKRLEMRTLEISFAPQ